jgi:hypothetical protein
MMTDITIPLPPEVFVRAVNIDEETNGGALVVPEEMLEDLLKVFQGEVDKLSKES